MSFTIDNVCATAREILATVDKKGKSSRRLEQIIDQAGKDKKYKTVRELDAALEQYNRDVQRRSF